RHCTTIRATSCALGVSCDITAPNACSRSLVTTDLEALARASAVSKPLQKIESPLANVPGSKPSAKITSFPARRHGSWNSCSGAESSTSQPPGPGDGGRLASNTAEYEPVGTLTVARWRKPLASAPAVRS